MLPNLLPGNPSSKASSERSTSTCAAPSRAGGYCGPKCTAWRYCARASARSPCAEPSWAAWIREESRPGCAARARRKARRAAEGLPWPRNASPSASHVRASSSAARKASCRCRTAASQSPAFRARTPETCLRDGIRSQDIHPPNLFQSLQLNLPSSL